jgi:hypothetical protein
MICNPLIKYSSFAGFLYIVLDNIPNVKISHTHKIYLILILTLVVIIVDDYKEKQKIKKEEEKFDLIATTLTDVAGGLHRGVSEVAEGLYDGVGDILEGTDKGIRHMGNGVYDSTGNFIGQTYNGVGSIIGGIYKGVGSVGDGLYDGVGEVVSGVYDSAGNLVKVIAKVNKNAGDLSTTLYDSVGDLGEVVYDSVGNVSGIVYNSIGDIGSSMNGEIRDISQSVQSNTKEVASNLYQTSSNVVSGIHNGVGVAGSSLNNAFGDSGSNLDVVRDNKEEKTDDGKVEIGDDIKNHKSLVIRTDIEFKHETDELGENLGDVEGVVDSVFNDQKLNSNQNMYFKASCDLEDPLLLKSETKVTNDSIKDLIRLSKNKDIIKKVGEKEFDKKGMIDNLPFETYIALNYILGDVIKLEIIRTKNDSYVTHDIKLNTRSIKSILFINNELESHVTYHKFVFKRLTTEDIKNFKIVPDHIKKYIYETPFRDDINNYLIICTTNNLILTKFNSKNVKNLDSLKTLIKENSYNARNILHMIDENNEINKFDL